jgi:hypothetical protein
VGQAARRQARAQRLEHLRQLADQELAGVDAQTAEWAVLIIHELASSRTWLAMRDDAGLDVTQAAEAVRWAIKALLANLRANAEGEHTREEQP